MSSGFLIDTNVVSESTALRAEPSVVAWLAENDADLWISTITLGELRYGVERLPIGAKRLKMQHTLERLLRRFRSRILPLDDAAADAWGRLRRRAELAQRTMPLEDAMLAAIAEARDLTLVTRNIRHFEGWDGPVFNPWPQPSPS
jgi:predicted nucleic acid-binding protein